VFQDLFQDKKSRIIAIIAGVVIAAILATALFLFLNQPKEEPQIGIPPDLMIEINWWNLHNNPIYEEIAKDFSSFYPNNLKINVVNINYNNGETYYKDLVMNFARGTAPDIFTLRNEDIPAWRQEGFIAPIKDISSFITGQSFTNQQLVDKYRQDFVPIVQKETVFRDEIYAVTNYVDNLQMYYNQQILNQAGIALRPKTWADLEKQIGILNKRNTEGDFEQSAIAMGTGLNVRNGDIVRDTNLSNFYDIIPALIFQQGNPIFDELTQRPVFGAGRNQQDVNTRNITVKNFEQIEEDNPSYSALRYFTSFVNTTNTRHSWNIDNQQNSKESFLNGKLAYSLNYRGFEQEIKEKNPRLKYGIAEMPQLDLTSKKTFGRFFADVMNSSIAIRGESEFATPADFWKYWLTRHFLYYLTEREVQEKILGATRMPSARFDLIDEQQKGDQNLALFASGNLYADTYYKPDPKRTNIMWGNLLYRVHYENIPLKQSLGQAVQEYNTLVQAGPKIDF
jgi:ABC-type glycerol-3-phosphate transport system substrate-binding protein